MILLTKKNDNLYTNQSDIIYNPEQHYIPTRTTQDGFHLEVNDTNFIVTKLIPRVTNFIPNNKVTPIIPHKLFCTSLITLQHI